MLFGELWVAYAKSLFSLAKAQPRGRPCKAPPDMEKVLRPAGVWQKGIWERTVFSEVRGCSPKCGRASWQRDVGVAKWFAGGASKGLAVGIRVRQEYQNSYELFTLLVGTVLVRKY